jgi:hypothetical protein
LSRLATDLTGSGAGLFGSLDRGVDLIVLNVRASFDVKSKGSEFFFDLNDSNVRINLMDLLTEVTNYFFPAFAASEVERVDMSEHVAVLSLGIFDPFGFVKSHLISQRVDPHGSEPEFIVGVG